MRATWLFLSLTLFDLVRSEKNDSSLLWGPYRPNLYFGLRPRLPQSLMTGLIWFGANDYLSIGRARHACDQGDELDSYTWTEFDPRRGGRQTIKDSFNNVQLTTEFVKFPEGSHSGTWSARIKGEPIDSAKKSRVSLVFYVGLEGLGGIDMETEENDNGVEGPVKITGSTPDLDEFSLRIVDDPRNRFVLEGMHADVFRERIGKTHLAGFRVPPGDVWKAKDIIVQDIISHAQSVLGPFRDGSKGAPEPAFVLQLGDELYSGSNIFAVQKTYDGAFEFDVYFGSASTQQQMDATIMNDAISELLNSISQRFKEEFKSADDAFDTPEVEKFSKAVTANLMGGVGYFYGTSIVDKGFAYEWDEEDTSPTETDDSEVPGKPEKGAKFTEPRALLTATPSRSFFPRGFYWDEGFHLLHIGAWDNDFSLEILKDWIGLIDENGWVAREQILGEEARSKVPAEFQTQVPTYANPPTLAMAVTAFIARFKEVNADRPSEEELGMKYNFDTTQTPLNATLTSRSEYLSSSTSARYFLQSIYAPLKRHYEWFRRTQRGQIKQYSRQARSRTEGYRWRGRSATHVLTSGMDDYPRGPPHSGELHLDLMSWMAFFSRTMKQIAEFIGEMDDAASYAEIETAIIHNLDDLHWSSDDNMYCDVSVNEDDESYHECHKGYLSLFPFLLGILPASSPHLGHILDLLYDPRHLWSPYGLRSLSTEHPEFGKGENYWKGPIWIQMNYLSLRALHEVYAKEEGPYQAQAQEIYVKLRKNVIENVLKEYKRTGYVWEQYDSQTGKGQRSHPFTGWTSLVSLMISEKYQ